MALIPHGFFPRSIFDAHSWLHPQAHGNQHGVAHHPAHPHNHTSLDLYDPFDELDRAVAKNFHWFHKPDFLDELPMFPRVPQKYRITVDCAGFKPASIKTELKDRVLTVSAHEEHKIGVDGSDDFSVKQFKKTYNLPENAIPEKMVSFMAHNGNLVVEVPLRETEKFKVGDLFPQIVNEDNGNKHVTMRFNVPEHIDPTKISVSIKDHDVIFRAEDEVKKPDGVSRFHYYQRTVSPRVSSLDHSLAHSA